VGPADLIEARVWRLTRRQYDNTVRDLLGDTSGPARAFLPEEGGTGFDNAEGALAFKDTNMADFQKAAIKLAADTVAKPDRLNAVFPCGEAKLDDDACSRDFVVAFGRRAFRRPLDPAEVTAYTAHLTLAQQKLDARAGVQAVIEAMLASPHFLFRVEIGGKPDAKGRVTLTPHELATQLSYLLWNSMPDPMLAAAADSGALADRAELERQARRLLDDPRAKATVGDFFLQVMGYDALDEAAKTGAYATPFKNVKPSLADETLRFVDQVLWTDDGTFGKLLGAPYTMANSTIATGYGAMGSTSTSTWQKLDLDAKDRAGLLTQLGLMAATSHPGGTSPVQRGKFVSERVLCVEIPDPPPDVMASEPAASTSKTTRQRYEMHATVGSCAACHKLLDAPGYAFEHLDPAGRVRRTENGQPVDTTGSLSGTDVDGPFTNVGELAKKLAGSAQAQACLTKQVFRYATGRHEGAADAGTITALLGRMQGAGGRVKELFLGQILSERFATRRAE
jgi:hypothetical protein